MRLSSKIWRTILVLVVWAPLQLVAAKPELAPSWFGAYVLGAPLSVWAVMALIIVLVCLAWLFSAAEDADAGERP